MSGSLGEEGAAVSVLPLVLGVTGAGLLTALAIWLPLRAGARRIRALEV